MLALEVEQATSGFYVWLQQYGALTAIAFLTILAGGSRLWIFYGSRKETREEAEARTLDYLAKVHSTIAQDAFASYDRVYQENEHLREENESLRGLIQDLMGG